MAKTESKGMRSGLHYMVEFLVILLGITVSVTLEKNRMKKDAQLGVLIRAEIAGY